MVFSWFGHTGLYVTPVEARKEEKTKKTTLCKTCVVRVVCPYGPLCHPCASKEGGKHEKTTFCKTWFFRGLAIRASMSPLWKQGRPRDKSHQTSAGPKKQKFWTSKCTKPARGTKKNLKTLQFTWEGASIPLKFLFFLSLCRFRALWSSKLLFFCPCAGLLHFEVQNPMHSYMCIVILYISIVCRLLCLYLHFCHSHAAFWRVRARFWFQEIGFLSIWNVNILKVIFIQDAFFTVICSVFEHVIIFII